MRSGTIKGRLALNRVKRQNVYTMHRSGSYGMTKLQTGPPASPSLIGKQSRVTTVHCSMNHVSCKNRARSSHNVTSKAGETLAMCSLDSISNWDLHSRTIMQDFVGASASASYPRVNASAYGGVLLLL